MMTVRIMAWGAIGGAAGLAHAHSLWRSAHSHHAPGLGLLWRLPMVTSVLVLAALMHAVFPATAGWVIGLATSSVVYLARDRRWM